MKFLEQIKIEKELSPKIIAIRENGLTLYNDSQFDAINVKVVARTIGYRTKEIVEEVLFEGGFIGKNGKLILTIKEYGYDSIIVNYDNPESGIKYLYCFNYNGSLLNVGDKYLNDINNIEYASPLGIEEYLEMSKKSNFK